MTQLDTEDLYRTAKHYLDKITTELERVGDEIGGARVALEEKLLPLENRWRILNKQREHWAEIVRMAEIMRGKSDDGKQVEIELSSMTYGQAAREVLYPNKHMRLKDIYKEIVRRGYKLSSETPSQSSFSAAISTIKKRFAKDADGKYYLIDPENRWWERK